MSNDRRIEAGTYTCRALVFNDERGESPAFEELSEDKLKVTVTLDLTDIGETVRTYLYFSETVNPGKTVSASAVSYPRYKSLGWKGNDVFDTRGLGDTEARVKISYMEFNGKETMNVSVMTGGSPSVSNIDDSRKRALAAKYRNPEAKTAPGPAIRKL